MHELADRAELTAHVTFDGPIDAGIAPEVTGELLAVLREALIEESERAFPGAAEWRREGRLAPGSGLHPAPVEGGVYQVIGLHGATARIPDVAERLVEEHGVLVHTGDMYHAGTWSLVRLPDAAWWRGGDVGRWAAPVAFGALAFLDGLLPALTGRPGAAAVAVSSNSITLDPTVRADLVDACLTGDEEAARAIAAEVPMSFARHT